MKKISLITFCLTVPLLIASLGAKVRHVDPEEFASLATGQNAIIVDVRTPGEIAQGKIKNSSELDFYSSQFERRLDRLQKDKTILVYCRSGNRSGSTAKMLESKGFQNIVNLEGGIGAWKNAKLPLVATETQSVQKVSIVKPSELNQTISENRFALLDFHTNWCVPCKRMAPVIDKLEDAGHKNLTIIRINADANESISEQLSVKAVPTFILFKDGKETWRDTGIIDLATFENLIKE